MKPRRSIPFLIALNVATIGITFWGSVTNPGLYQYKLARLASRDVTNTLLGLFSIGGLLVATVAQPMLGLLSDRTQSRFGRRAPYLLLGAAGVAISAFAITGAGSLPLLFGAILFSQLASNTIQGPWQALSPDQVPDTQKGAAAGFKTIFDLLAVIASGLVIRALLASEQIALLAFVLSAVVVTTSLITVICTPDIHITSGSAQATPQAPNRLAVREQRDLMWWLVNRFLFWAGLIALRQFIIGYLQDVGHYSETSALAISGDFTILLGIGVVLVTLPAGLLSDRVGRTRLIALSGLIASVGALVLIFAHDANQLRLVAVVAGAGAGMYFSINWALVTAIVPSGQPALFLGIANIATTLGSVAGQLGGLLIDGVNRTTGTVNGYFLLFALAAIFFLLSAAAILRIDERRPGAVPGSAEPLAEA